MCDHLPLKKFLKRNTLNAKVNNWAVELSSHQIEFRYIKGIKNTLADTMSRLVQIDSDIELPDEEEGKEYGYAIFEPLPLLLAKKEINFLMQGKTTYKELQTIEQMGDNTDKSEPIFLPNEEIKLPLEDSEIDSNAKKRQVL